MAWPPQSNGTNVIIKGSVTTIVWGTGGFAAGFGSGTGIVKGIKVSSRTGEFPIENGSGLTAQEVLVMDGLDYEVTVEDDSNITWPIDGTNVVIVCPQMIINGASNTGNITCLITKTDYNGARKTAGERVLMMKSFNLFTP